MAVLNQWQRIDRVLSGKPFGDGKDGSYSSATIPTLTKDSCSGSADSTTLTTTGSTFTNGDVILIHQTRGSGAGQWEINQVLSGGGTTSLTLKKALKYTYTDSGASQAQAVKILRYKDVTVQSGTWTVPAWDENVGGIFPLAVRETLTVTGNIVATSSGYNFGPSGTRTSSAGVSNGYQGEGPPADSSQSTAANGSSGGGGTGGDPGRGGGGGGGHAANGTGGTGPGTPGAGGGTDGAADLTDMLFGGTGGTGGANNGTSDGDYGGYGGRGGGLIILFVKNISLSGQLNSNGGTGTSRTEGGGGGGGAGGSTLLVCKTGIFGTNLITVAAGGGGTGSAGGAGDGGAGAVGRIAVHHSGTVTGTTNPSFTDVEDKTLIEKGGFMALL